MNHRATALGLVLGLVVGLLAATTGSALLGGVAQASEPFGTLFINAVRMVVIPLVATTLFAGVARLGSPREIGRIGGGALGFFWGTTVPAIVIGMGFMTVAVHLWPVTVDATAAATTPNEIPGLLDFVLRLVPPNPFRSLADGALLQVIVVTVLAGAAAGAIERERRERLIGLADDVAAVFVKLIHWILWTAPLGVFGLAAPVMARMGMDLLVSLAVFVATVVVGLFVFMALFYLPAVRVLGRMAVRRFVRGVVGTYTIGFSTTSSIAALPVMFEDAERLGVRPDVSSLVLPLGAAINRAGSALFQGAAVVFLAALAGTPLALGTYLSAGVVVFLVAMSVAPIPSASIVTLAPALEAAGVPTAGLGILLGIDRVPDMFRSATNITGHVAAAVVVDGLGGSAQSDPSSGSGTPATATTSKSSVTDSQAVPEA